MVERDRERDTARHIPTYLHAYIGGRETPTLSKVEGGRDRDRERHTVRDRENVNCDGHSDGHSVHRKS